MNTQLIKQYESVFADRTITSESDIQMLVAQLRFPDQTCRSRELACKFGKKTMNSQYGRLGKRIAAELKLTLPTRGTGEPKYWRALSNNFNVPETEEWVMLPEVAQALRNLGYAEYV